MLLRRTLLTITILTFIASAANLGHATEEPSGYYGGSQRGWWWGERPVAEEQIEEEQPEKPARQEEPKKDRNPPPLSAYKYSDIWNMHPDDFIEMQEAYKKKAVQAPSEANTKDYYELSEIARKKAQAFTNASQYIWQKYPEMTVVKDYPVNTPGNLSRLGSIADERRAVLRSNQDKYALIYFWQPGCSYCDAQKKILKWFESETNWIVKPVNILENPEAAARVGVQTTPTVVLIKKGVKDHFPVSAGVISAAEMEDKAYRAVRLLNGDITPQEYSIHDFQKGGGFDVNSRKDWVKQKE